MGRKSTIAQLDPRIREAVDAAIRDGRATIQDIVDLIREMGGAVSHSAAGRYKQNAEAQMGRYREAQEVAKVWVDRLEAEPQGDVARLLPEMLRTIAFQVLGEMGNKEEGPEPMDLMLLAKSLDHLGKAGAAQTAIALKMRQERERIETKLAALEKQAQAQEGKPAGPRRIDAETLRIVREEIYGIVK